MNVYAVGKNDKKCILNAFNDVVFRNNSVVGGGGVFVVGGKCTVSIDGAHLHGNNATMHSGAFTTVGDANVTVINSIIALSYAKSAGAASIGKRSRVHMISSVIEYNHVVHGGGAFQLM